MHVHQICSCDAAVWRSSCCIFRFGPGMVIYWFGFIDELNINQEKGIILRDHFPEEIVKMDPSIIWEERTRGHTGQNTGCTLCWLSDTAADACHCGRWDLAWVKLPVNFTESVWNGRRKEEMKQELEHVVCSDTHFSLNLMLITWKSLLYRKISKQ